MCSAAARLCTSLSVLGMMSGHSGLALCSPRLRLLIPSSVQGELRAQSRLLGVREKRPYLHITEEEISTTDPRLQGPVGNFLPYFAEAEITLGF